MKLFSSIKDGVRGFLADCVVNGLQAVRMIFLLPRGSCRFSPTCSAYAREAIIHHSPPVALFKVTWRIILCNPFSAGGYDPVFRTSCSTDNNEDLS